MSNDLNGTIEETPATLANRLGLAFKDLLLLRRALTHRSYLNEHPEALDDNERLEFLGDAVLDFIVGAWLYNRFPEMAEGELTRMRSALVCTEQLADFGRFFDLGKAMRLGRGEVQAGGRMRDALLCATFEALVGAIYLSCGLGAVQDFIHPLLLECQVEEIIHKDVHDPKSRLQEWSQSRKMGIPQYITVHTSGPDHERIFVVEVEIDGKTYGRGSGHSKQAAARSAAWNALAVVQKQD